MPAGYPQQTPYLQSGAPGTENRPPDGYSGGQLGIRFALVDPTDGRAKAWQLVQADSAMDVAITQGAVAYWRNPTGYVVTTKVANAGRGNVAGVFQCAVDVGNIGCVQQGGYAQVAPQTAPTSPPTNTGKIVIPSATDGVADVLAAGDPATYPALGVSEGTTNADVTGLFPAQLSIVGRP